MQVSSEERQVSVKRAGNKRKGWVGNRLDCLQVKPTAVGLNLPAGVGAIDLAHLN
jgi:hypothetical protein